MSDNTKIAWCDATWSPVTGCTKISTGCKHCFAERMAHRLKAMKQPKYNYDDPFAVRCHPQELRHRFGKKPKRIFVCSMSDWCHEKVPFKFLCDILNVMDHNPQMTFITLTKRVDRQQRLLKGLYGDKPMAHHWVGATVENQKCADERIPILLDTPAAVRFISIEPCLSLVDISGEILRQLDWVIVGPETGPGARECVPAWINDIVADCCLHKVPCFVKAFPMPNGKVSHDIEDWPSWAQVQQYPEVTT